jgi:hypothetical protein
MHRVVLKLPFVLHPSSRLVDANAMLTSVVELSLVAGSVRPSLDTSSRFQICYPLSFIAAFVVVDALAVSFQSIANPLALINAAAPLEDALAVGLVVKEIALVR